MRLCLSCQPIHIPTTKPKQTLKILHGVMGELGDWPKCIEIYNAAIIGKKEESKTRWEPVS